MKSTLTLLIAIFCVSGAFAQVDEIKEASKQNSSGSSGSVKSGDGSGGSSDGNGISLDVFFILFEGIGVVQSHKLQRDRERYPSMISLDVGFQGAIKPSSYYTLNPRIRGNWGLFSTDFRLNYLIEDDIEGFKHIRTTDWQILQVNLITTRLFTFRIGSGIMKESFGEKRTFSESSVMLNIHAPDQSKVLGFEFRFAKDWDTDVNPRSEFSVQYQEEIFDIRSLHAYVTLGGLYQRYYNTIDVWGVQAGLVFRLF